MGLPLKTPVCAYKSGFQGHRIAKSYCLDDKIIYTAGVTQIVRSMIRKYHNHKQQTTPWHSEEEPLNHHETPGRQIKQSNQLSLPHQDDCNTRMGIK